MVYLNLQGLCVKSEIIWATSDLFTFKKPLIWLLVTPNNSSLITLQFEWADADHIICVASRFNVSYTN